MAMLLTMGHIGLGLAWVTHKLDQVSLLSILLGRTPGKTAALIDKLRPDIGTVQVKYGKAVPEPLVTARRV